MQLSDMIPFQDFEKASCTVLAFLRHRLGFGLWVITRAEGNHWIVLQAEESHYGIDAGTVICWDDSYCSRMVKGDAPRVAPCISKIPVYDQLPMTRQFSPGAYIGVPIAKADGSLFGTLCALDAHPQNEKISEELPLIEMFGKLLGTILTIELKALEQARNAETYHQQAITDKLTGLLNRQGWDQAVEREESRARRYGSPVAVLIIDLNGLKQVNDTQGHHAGDQLIQKASQALTQATRKHDIVARLGGDEFGVLAIDCDELGSERLLQHLRDQFAGHHVMASFGKALRHPKHGLKHAIVQADQRMYTEKMAVRSPSH
jgi:diguanylate cyclase (GGDEF)-like protein